MRETHDPRSISTRLNTQASSVEAVQGVIDDTANGVGLRIYGGHILVAAGDVNMVNCHVWDYFVLIQLTDAIGFGGDILVRRIGIGYRRRACPPRYSDNSPFGLTNRHQVISGTINMVGCSFTATVLFAKCVGVP